MFDFIQAIPFSFAALFPVLNPLGCAVIFLTLTFGATRQELTRVSRKIAINTAILLIVVLFTGAWILRFFGITIPIVEVGGGLVITYIGWTLLNSTTTEPKPNQPYARSDRDVSSLVFFPLTMPITAGPGCIAITLTIGAHETQHDLTATLMGQAGAVVGILLSSIVVFFCYNYAFLITKKLGTAGLEVIMRLSAFINLCIGLSVIWRGVQGLLIQVIK